MLFVMHRRSLFAALLTAALLTACGGKIDLTARGQVGVTLSDGTPTGFAFSEDTRLDAPAESGAGLFTGDCEMAPLIGGEAWGVVVDIRNGGTVEDNGLTAITIMQRTDELSGGRVEATLGTRVFASDETCSVSIPYVSAQQGMVGVVADGCQLMAEDGSTAVVSLELDMTGCTLLE